MEYVYSGIVFLLFLLWLFIKKMIVKISLKKRFDNAIKQEKEARNLLIENGYRVLDYQYEIVYNILKGDEKLKIRVTPDYVVKKNGKKYIVEVKTGMVANIKNRHTRRQILEYFYAGGLRTLLVDMNKKKIMEIKFEDKSKIWKRISIVLLFFLFMLLSKKIYENINEIENLNDSFKVYFFKILGKINR